MIQVWKPLLKVLHFLLFLLQLHCISSYLMTPMNCTDTSRVCTSFLAFKPQPNQTLAVIQSMFDVLPSDITVEGNDWDYIFIRKNCSCANGIKKYVSSTTYTVKSNGGLVYDLVMDAYDGLAFLPNTSRMARNGAVVSLRLFCGCSSGLWNYLMSYVMRDGDSVESLASRFGVSMDSIESVNGIDDPDNVTVGSLYYIPLDSVPGDPYPLKNATPPAPVPAPSVDNFSGDQLNHKAHVPYGWIIGGLGVGLALIILSIFLCVCLRSEARSNEKGAQGKISHKFHILRNPSFFCGSGRYICGKAVDQKQTDGESSHHQVTIPKVSREHLLIGMTLTYYFSLNTLHKNVLWFYLFKDSFPNLKKKACQLCGIEEGLPAGNAWFLLHYVDSLMDVAPDDWRSYDPVSGLGPDIFGMDKPVVFAYENIFSSTDGFSDSNLLGHGTYGSVYYSLLHDQEVAIKRMTATKTKEFMSEVKVLCKVHHSNLVELIGYAASHDELFLVYEYAQKGSLRSHLHDPQNKGHSPLSWIIRVQIVLDAARGIEYIHEHTKTHYVHRDIKTSNILLDASFRAKISDFGLAKLVGITNEGEVSTTKVVGTYGYLAPEYLSDGLATTKSDVYAFGVVLFEIITGKEAIIRTEGTVTKTTERRSLASVMLAVLRNSPDSMSMSSMKDYIDPNIMNLYPHDCVFKMAMLAKQCVDDDPILRPDMKQVVISLSQILLSSIEWEATLAGNSQVFSGLVQGR